MRTTRHLVAALAAAVLLLSSCSGSDEPRASIPESEVFNDADVAFATDMIPHHAQALVMVDMTRGRDLSPEFEQLTQQILDAQGPEIEQMSGWLKEWDQPVPETSRDHVNSHDMEGMDMGDMPGMMSEAELDDVESMQGSGFEQMWMTMMIRHHEGAIEMAEIEQEDGEFPDAITLADNIVASQQAEIEQMQAMLDR